MMKNSLQDKTNKQDMYQHALFVRFIIRPDYPICFAISSSSSTSISASIPNKL